MPNEDQTLTFGTYLKTIREKKGIALRTVSEATRIALVNLTFIEEENHQRLPAEVFVRGYLRSYAQFIGADPEEVVRLYQKDRQHLTEQVSPPIPASLEPRRPWRQLLLALGAVLMVIFASVYIISLFETKPETPAPTAPVAQERASTTVAEPQPPGDNERQAAQATAPTAAPVKEVQTAVAPPAPRPASQVFRLEIAAVEETWLKIIKDTDSAKEYSLAPGNTLALEAKTSFNLLIGNAAGVRLTFNGEQIDVPGKKGQVVNLVLP